MGDWAKVSVVVPCYNSHQYLGQSLESIRAQTYPNIEVVIVDDGSNDPATIAFLDALPSDVIRVRQSNRGLPAARNAGIATASGEYILPLDTDDWLEPEAVSCLLEALESSPDFVFSFATIQMEGEASGVLVKQFNRFEQLFLNQLPYCIMYRKGKWTEAGGYDESMRSGYEDWEFNIRLSALGNGVRVPKPLFHYRVQASGMLLSKSSRLHQDLWNGIRKKHRSWYSLTSLFQLWRKWRGEPSTYPLWTYFPWMACCMVLPAPIFRKIFEFLRQFSQRHRVS